MKTSVPFLILFLILSIDIKSQDVFITGKVLSEDNIKLVGATVELNKTTGTVVDKNGRFEITAKNSDQKISLSVRMIGYEVLDTIIQTDATKIHLELKLKETYYEQPELVISDDRIISVFGKADWVILDSKIFNDFLYLIYIESNKRYIGLAKPNGAFIDKLRLNKRYDEIKESCTGLLYLISQNEYATLNLNPNLTLNLEAGKSLEVIKDFVEPCLFKINHQFVFKSYAKHNKEVSYFTYNEDKKQELLLQLEDEKARLIAQSYYNEIIRMYYVGISSPQKGTIDEGGVDGINIIERGEWSGELEDLIGTLDPEIIFAISYYKNVEAQPIKTLELEWKNRGYVLDLLNLEAYELLNNSTDHKKLEFKNSELINEKQSYRILQDKSKRTNYLIDKTNRIYKLSIYEDELKIEPFFEIEKGDAFVKNVMINDGFLYYVYQPNKIVPYTKLKIEAVK